MSTESSGYNCACNIQKRQRNWNRETEKFGAIRWEWRGRTFQTVCGKSSWETEIQVQSLTPYPNGSHPLWSEQACQLAWIDNKTCSQVWKECTLSWIESLTVASGGETHLNGRVSHENRETAVKVFVDSQHLSSQAWKGRLTNKLSLCFHSDLWMACASACDSQMPGKTRLAHKKPALCRKPVITAIIQLDLICIIKLCYCLALEDCKSHRLYDGGHGGT